jgi:voltage-gated potassium channel
VAILKRIVEQHDTTRGLVFDLVIQFLILVSLVTFSFETLPHLSAKATHWLYIVEVVTVSIFTLEYLLRLWVADHKGRFAFSFLE